MTIGIIFKTEITMSVNQAKYQCDECQKIVTANVGQTVINSQLRWYLSYECPSCNSAIEMDGIGFPPDEIRQNILAEEGEWNLIVKETELKNKAKLSKLIRQALNLSLQEVLQRLKNFPIITSGTKTEMQWLKQVLAEEGIDSSVEQKIQANQLLSNKRL